MGDLSPSVSGQINKVCYRRVAVYVVASSFEYARCLPILCTYVWCPLRATQFTNLYNTTINIYPTLTRQPESWIVQGHIVLVMHFGCCFL